MLRMTLRTRGTSAATLVLLFICGCTLFYDRHVDVTHSPKWWGDMHLGEVLRLNTDAFLSGNTITSGIYRSEGTNGPRSYLDNETSLKMYKANPTNWPDLHLLSKGTRFRCVKLERFYSVESARYYVYGETLDGEFRGTILLLPCALGNPSKKGSLRFHSLLLERERD